MRRLQRAFTRFADHKWWAVLFTGVLGTCLSAAVALAVAWPEPRIHDEFSYLLAADTFASGRITNPTHSLWTFFETFHVNVLPTYCSIYPPGQGLFLALGQLVTGQAIVGVWLSFGLASAAVCWMLQAYLPPRWALLGALLCMLRVGFLGAWAGQQGYWSQSYWGGAVAMLGGAIAFGAVPKIIKAKVGGTVALGIGLAILATSRPYEGLAASIPIIVLLTAWVFQENVWRRLRRIAIPLLAILGITVGAMAYYNFRLTGDPFRMAYQESASAYAVVPTFIWQDPRPEPSYRHDVIRDYQVNWAGDRYAAKRSIPGFANDLVTRFMEFTSFFLGVALLIPFVALPRVLHDKWMRFAAGGCAAVLIALCLTTWFQPHYAAPLTAPLFALVTQGLRYVRTWRRGGNPSGVLFVRAVPVAYAVLFLVSVLAAHSSPNSWHRHRARLQRDLEADGERHLILVRYGPKHDCTEEWVYNRADIEEAAVVWARDMGHEVNRPLVAHFATRRIWLLTVEADDVRLVSYPRSGP